MLCDVCSLADSPAANRNVLGDTIVIRNAQASDSAVYQCEAANVHGKLLSNANIMIMSEFAAGKTINKKTFETDCGFDKLSADLAPVVLTPDEEEYSAVEGKVVRMRCEVFSSPPPDVYW